MSNSRRVLNYWKNMKELSFTRKEKSFLEAFHYEINTLDNGNDQAYRKGAYLEKFTITKIATDQFKVAVFSEKTQSHTDHLFSNIEDALDYLESMQ